MVTQPTMAKTVAWLRTNGFNTTDSGDGFTNVGAGMEGALNYPHVFMVVKPEKLVEESDRLFALCDEHGLCMDSPEDNVRIESTYSPFDGVAVIMLCNVNDEVWETPSVLEALWESHQCLEMLVDE